MTDLQKSRRKKLEEFLAQNPNDAFSRYGLALDCVREGDVTAAETHFQYLLANSTDYVPAYQMYAQMLMQNGRGAEAKPILENGIAAASRLRNHHAQSEMEGMLAELA
jgi:predicted Zn-dependent protease